MTTKLTAAESIRRLAQQFQSMVEAADLLEALGSTEQAAAEAADAAKKARADRDKAIKALAATQTDIDASQARLEAMHRDAEIEAASIVATAADRGERLIADAMSQIASQQAAATKDLANEIDKLRAEIGKQVALKASTQGEIERLAASRDDAMKQSQDAESKLAKVQDSIRKLAAA